MLNNEELAICEVCGKEFIKRKVSSKGQSGRKSIRGSKMKTCSKKCSKKRMKMINKIKKN